MATEIAASLDVTTIATNIGVGLGLAGAAIAAIWKAVKKIKEAMPSDDPTVQRVMSGMIMDNTTLLMWSESNRTVGDKIDDLTDEMKELRFAVTQLKDTLK